MMEQHELTFLVHRTEAGKFRVVSTDCSMTLERQSYRELRRDLEILVRAEECRRPRIRILIGRPRWR